MADDELMNKLMADAVQQAAAEAYDGDMVTRWLCLIEVIGTDGERGLIISAQPGMKTWDTLGMLTFAVQLEQVGTLRGDDDG